MFSPFGGKDIDLIKIPVTGSIYSLAMSTLHDFVFAKF